MLAPNPERRVARTPTQRPDAIGANRTRPFGFRGEPIAGALEPSELKEGTRGARLPLASVGGSQPTGSDYPPARPWFAGWSA